MLERDVPDADEPLPQTLVFVLGLGAAIFIGWFAIFFSCRRRGRRCTFTVPNGSGCLLGVVMLAVFLVAITSAAIVEGFTPPSHVQTIDPAKVAQTPPFDHPGLA